MGLIRSVDNIQQELEKQKKQQLLDKIQKQKEKQQKENLKRYKIELEDFLKNYFTKYFKLAGTSYLLQFYNIELKKEIFENYLNTIETTDKNGFCYYPFKGDLQRHFDNKYNIILKKCYNEQKNYEQYLLSTTEIKEEKQKTKFNFGAFIITILFVLFLPVLAILFIIIRLYKSNEIKKSG